MTQSPTFVAKFADSQIVRMTCHCKPTRLDLKRGIALARAAWSSRKANKGQPVPAIVEAEFVEAGDGGKVLRTYSAKELEKAHHE